MPPTAFKWMFPPTHTGPSLLAVGFGRTHIRTLALAVQVPPLFAVTVYT